MNAAASDAKYSAAFAISSGMPSRPSGCRATSASRAAAGSSAPASKRATHSVSTVPGQMQLQRTPVPAYAPRPAA